MEQWAVGMMVMMHGAYCFTVRECMDGTYGDRDTDEDIVNCVDVDLQSCLEYIKSQTPSNFLKIVRNKELTTIGKVQEMFEVRQYLPEQ